MQLSGMPTRCRFTARRLHLHRMKKETGIATCVVIKGELVNQGDVLCELASGEGLRRGRALDVQLMEEIAA